MYFPNELRTVWIHWVIQRTIQIEMCVTIQIEIIMTVDRLLQQVYFLKDKTFKFRKVLCNVRHIYAELKRCAYQTSLNVTFWA